MEDDPKKFKSGRRTTNFQKWKKTGIFSNMENDQKNIQKWKTNKSFGDQNVKKMEDDQRIKNGRRPTLFF